MEPRHDLAPWCEALPLLRRLAAAQGLGAEVEEAVERARDGRDGHNGHDTEQQLAEIARRLGLPGIGARSVLGVPGLPPGRPADDLYVCPGALCTRDWVPAPGVPAPTCHIFGGGLEPEPRRRLP